MREFHLQSASDRRETTQRLAEAVGLGRALRYATRPQQFLYFFPLPQGQGSLRPTFGNERRIGRSIDTSPGPSPSPSPPTAAIAPTGWRMRASAAAVGAVGPSSRRRNCGNVARKFSNACRLEVLRNRLFRTSFLMFAINSTNMSYASVLYSMSGSFCA